jgi:hypothetical protein
VKLQYIKQIERKFVMLERRFSSTEHLMFVHETLLALGNATPG